MSDIHDETFPLRSPFALLLAEFIRVITRSHLVVWKRADAEDLDAGFCADLDLGDSDLAIGIYPEGQGFEADVIWNMDDEPMLPSTDDGGADLYMPESMAAAVDAKLYAEVKEAYSATA
jgi:hypothetical protein